MPSRLFYPSDPWSRQARLLPCHAVTKEDGPPLALLPDSLLLPGLLVAAQPDQIHELERQPRALQAHPLRPTLASLLLPW